MEFNIQPPYNGKDTSKIVMERASGEPYERITRIYDKHLTFTVYNENLKTTEQIQRQVFTQATICLN